MHGRTTSVVLPALIVLALVAIVAIASTGSTPSSSGETRPPSDALLDTIFSLGLVAVAIGAVILLYGLAQRKAIARELSTERYRRTGLVSFLAFFAAFTAFSHWRLTKWTPPQAEEGEEFAFPGELPPDSTTPEHGAPATAYEPSVSWIPIALVVGLVLAAGIAYFVSERRTRRGHTSRASLAAQLEAALDESLDDLRAEPDPRKAIIAAYARLERVLSANGVPRRAAETSDEYLPRVLHDLELDSGAIERLTALFTRAKFSQHDVDTAMKEEAIGALEHVRDELRLAREKPGEIGSPAAVAGAPS